MSADPAVAAIVLAGGRSSRFGRDKLAEPLDGRPLLDHAIAAVGHVATDVLARRRPGCGSARPARRADRSRRAGVRRSVGRCRRRPRPRPLPTSCSWSPGTCRGCHPRSSIAWSRTSSRPLPMPRSSRSVATAAPLPMAVRRSVGERDGQRDCSNRVSAGSGHCRRPCTRPRSPSRPGAWTTRMARPCSTSTRRPTCPEPRPDTRRPPPEDGGLSRWEGGGSRAEEEVSSGTGSLRASGGSSWCRTWRWRHGDGGSPTADAIARAGRASRRWPCGSAAASSMRNSRCSLTAKIA